MKVSLCLYIFCMANTLFFSRSQSHLLVFLRYNRGYERRMSEVWHGGILIDPKRESWKGTGEEKSWIKSEYKLV